jgi:hypothetical protein
MSAMKNGASKSHDDKPKKEKFDFDKMKLAATHENSAVRKKIFIEYFERFEEFPSYLFDNESETDSRLLQTIEDIQRDPETTKEMRAGIDMLLRRLPS